MAWIQQEERHAKRFLVGVGALVGCSSSEFTVARGTSDTGSAAGDGGATADGSTDAATPPIDGGNSDASRDDTSTSSIDAAPVDAGCVTTIPAAACAAPPPGAYEQQFAFASYTGLTPRLGREQAHLISYVTSKAGRHEKLIAQLRRVTVDAGGAVGTISVEAFLMPCPGVLVPLGRVSKLPVNEAGDMYSFYFRDGDGNALPVLPAGTRLAFQITHDSARYQLELTGNPTPTGTPPQGLQWWTRNPTGDFKLETALPSANPWLRACG